LWRNGINVTAKTWNPEYSNPSLSWKVLITDFASSDLIPKDHYISYFGLPDCSFDVYIYCNFGLVSIILLSVLITFIAFIILRILVNITPQEIVKENDNYSMT